MSSGIPSRQNRKLNLKDGSTDTWAEEEIEGKKKSDLPSGRILVFEGPRPVDFLPDRTED